MHWDNAVGDDWSLPPECILYFEGYTFEEAMEFVLESLALGVIEYQGKPTDKFLEGEFIPCVACISKQQSSKYAHEKHHLVCPLSKDYHRAIQEKIQMNWRSSRNPSDQERKGVRVIGPCKAPRHHVQRVLL